MPGDPSVLFAAPEQAVRRVVQVNVLRSVDAFLAELEHGRPILRRCGVEATIRAWLATYAGTDTGIVLLTLEFADQAAFFRSEQAYGKAVEDEEFRIWAQALPELRSVISDNLHIEITEPR